MTFGQPSDFAIETYHEPSGPKWAGFGRVSVDIQDVRLGKINEKHCSLFHFADRLRDLHPTIAALWDEAFNGLSDAEIFSVLDEALYQAGTGMWARYGRFDFLTNAGEQFDGFKTFIICRPAERVTILYQLPDDELGSASCSAHAFKHVSASFVLWFDEQVRTIAPPWFSV